MNDRTIPFSAGLARDFLSFAAIAPLPSAALEAVKAYADDLAAKGMGIMPAWVETRERLRRDLGTLVGVEPTQLALTHGTTHGVQIIAHSFRWTTGKAMVCFEHEFPTNVHSWRSVSRALGTPFHLLPLDVTAGGAEALDAFLAATPTQLVAVSAVQFQSGRRMPLATIAEVCHRHGALLFVDAVQAAGVVPLALAEAGVDFAAGGGHKWLLGGDGVGWLYVAPGREGRLEAALTGWMSVEEPFRFLSEPDALDYGAPLQPIPRCFEASSTSGYSVVSLAASVAEILRVGVDRIFAATQAYHDALEPLLVAAGFISERASDPRSRSGILALFPPKHVELKSLQAAVAASGVAVSIPDGRLRIAPHLHNRPEHAAEVARIIIDATR